MQIKNLEKDETEKIFNLIDEYLNQQDIKWIKYLDLGIKTIKIISYCNDFLPLVERQLTYILKDEAKNFDDTLIIWNEKDVLSLAKKIALKIPKIYTRIKFENTFRKAHNAPLLSENELYELRIINDNFSKVKPLIDFQVFRKFFIANNIMKHKYYYGVYDLSIEEFIKEGHIFVQFFNNILKSETSNLVHGAVIGHKNTGICFCARGQRGKSTLSVLSMMKGFEYVSDDYLILHKNNENELLASPIYSIITLSPTMYNKLYDLMGNSRFISNNARKDKYVFNISNFHDRFRKNYPIKLCMFPEITANNEPSIRLCTKEEKGRAIVQLIQSTLMQTQDLSEHFTVKKIMDMVKKLPFYKFNLCYDIDKNTEFLKNFMDKFETLEKKIAESEKIAIDITFNLANILDTQKGIIYSMSKSATNIFENLLNGVSIDIIFNELKKYKNENPYIIEEFKSLVEELEKKEILNTKNNLKTNLDINLNFLKEDNFKFSFKEHAQDKDIELIKIGEKNVKLCIK